MQKYTNTPIVTVNNIVGQIYCYLFNVQYSTDKVLDMIYIFTFIQGEFQSSVI